jgi:hypothetical protein
MQGNGRVHKTTQEKCLHEAGNLQRHAHTYTPQDAPRYTQTMGAIWGSAFASVVETFYPTAGDCPLGGGLRSDRGCQPPGGRQ